MQYHVLKKRLSPEVRAMLNSPQGSWESHPQARAYADLNFLLGKDAKDLELKAIWPDAPRLHAQDLLPDRTGGRC